MVLRSLTMKHGDAKGLYGVVFPYYETLAAIYGRDIATGEGAEGLGEAITNMEQEVAAEYVNDQEEEERMSRETPRRSTDSTSSSSKKHKKDGKGKESVSNDPLLVMFNEVSGDLKIATKTVGIMASTMEREAAIQEKAMNEDPQQKLREKAVAELARLGFSGSEQVKTASVFVRVPDQMSMLLVLHESLRREFIINMLSDEGRRKRAEGRTV